MGSSTEKVGPTEDTILGLLDFLVDPLLPCKPFSSRREGLSPSQEESVAKQVHAVALLYNYYHRKEYPGLEFLESESFCKMAVALKPGLLPYLRLTQRADHAKVDEKELSLTEKAIMNACNICRSLDASKNNPTIDGWPITRVAVFLVDDKKENCYLFHSSITQGVWSVIEKDVDALSQNSEAVTQLRSGDKKRRVAKRAPKQNQPANDASLQQLAYAAVKEACGINQGDLKTVENHVVYSIGKEKTAVRLYIMQCTLSNQDMNLVPINDAMESLQGPLVQKESGSWIATPAVEYFHLLPFADKVSDWLSREGLLSISQNSEAQKEGGICDVPQLYVDLSSSMLNHFEAVNGVENHYCQSEEPLVNISEASEVAEVSNGSCQLKEESLPQSSLHAETPKEVEDRDSSRRKGEKLENTSQTFTMEEVRNGDCQLKDEPCQLKDEPLSNSLPHSETAMEVERNNSSHLKEEPHLKTPQHFVPGKESTNCRCQLKEVHLLRSSPHSESAKKVEDHKISRRKGERSETVVYTKRKRSQRNSSNKSPASKKSNSTAVNSGKEKRECAVTVSSNNTDIDEAGTTCSLIDGKSKNLPCENDNDNQKQIILAEEDQTTPTDAAIVVAELNDILAIAHDHDAKRVSDGKIPDTAVSILDENQEHTLLCSDSNLEYLHKLQLTIASKNALLSETALKVLFRKRDRLSQQLRSMTDEIALCDRSIQSIIDGGEDGLAVKIDAVIEGCNNECLRSAPEIEDRTNLQIINPDLPPVMKRKRLSEANLSVYSPCQELDGICNVNNWTLPTYNVLAAEGGFQASVTMEGPDFRCSSEGSICATPDGARDLAATKLLAKLRSMAAES